MTQTDKGQFVQFPLHLIYGCPDLNRDDKWVLLSIMGSCWSDDPQRLSYRDIAAISGVPLSLISSYTDKNGVMHEGIADRLVRLNYIRIIVGKEVNHSTGKVKGNAQSYLFVNYSYIWRMNVMYCNAKKSAQEEFKVAEKDYQPVSNTNRLVSNRNTSVPIENEPVSNTNEPVSVVSTKTDTYITVDNIDTTDNIDKERVADATAPSELSSQEIDPDKTEERPIVKPSQKERANGHAHQHPIVDSDLPTRGDLPQSSKATNTPTLRQATQASNMGTQPPLPKKPPTNTIPKRPKQQPITTPVSPEAQRILDDWVSLFTKKIVINQGDIDAAEHLVPTNITCEEMRQERLWLFSTDNPQKPWYRKIGVCLADIDKKYSQWQSLNEAPKPPPGKDESNEHRATQQPANAFIERCLDKDYNKRKLEEMREKNALKRQAQAAKGV